MIIEKLAVNQVRNYLSLFLGLSILFSCVGLAFSEQVEGVVKAGMFVVGPQEVTVGEIIVLKQEDYIGESFENPAWLVKAFSGEVHNANHIIDKMIQFDKAGRCEIDTSRLEPGTYYVQIRSYPIHDNVFITSEYFNVKPASEEVLEEPSFYTGSGDVWSCKVTPRDQNMDGESVIADFKLDEYVDFNVDIDLVEKKLYVSARIREDSKIYTDGRIPRIFFEEGRYEVEQIQKYSENDILVSGTVPITCAGDNIIAVNYWILQGGRAVYKNAFYPLNIPEYENSEDRQLISFISWMREKGYSQPIVDRYEKIAKNPICRGWWMQHFFNLRDESVDHNNWLHFLDKIHNQSPVTIYFHDMIPTDQGAEHTALPDVGDGSNSESMESHFEKIFGCDFEFIYEAHNVNYVDTFGEPNYRGGFIDNFGGTRVSIMDACASLVGINKYNEGMSHIFHLAIDKLNGKRVDVMRHSPMLVTSLNDQVHSEWIHEYLHQMGIGHCYLAVDPFYSSSDYEPSLSVGLDSYMSTLGYVTSDDSTVRNRILDPMIRYAFEPSRTYDDDATFAQVYNGIRDNGSWMLSENFPPRRPMVNIDIVEENSSGMKLRCLAGASFDHEGDDVTYLYQWYKNGRKQKDLTDAEIEISKNTSGGNTSPVIEESGEEVVEEDPEEEVVVEPEEEVIEEEPEEEEVVEEEPEEEEVEEETEEEVVEEEPEEELGEGIKIIHTPITEAERGKDLEVFAQIRSYEDMEYIYLHYRNAGSRTIRGCEMIEVSRDELGKKVGYKGIISGTELTGEFKEYRIYVEDKDVNAHEHGFHRIRLVEANIEEEPAEEEVVEEEPGSKDTGEIDLLPDLTIKEIEIKDNGYITVRIGNIGEGKCPQGGGVSIKINGDLRCYLLDYLGEQRFREPGEEIEVTVEKAETGVSYDIEAHIDCFSGIEESNENNNTLTKTVVIGPVEDTTEEPEEEVVEEEPVEEIVEEEPVEEIVEEEPEEEAVEEEPKEEVVEEELEEEEVVEEEPEEEVIEEETEEEGVVRAGIFVEPYEVIKGGTVRLMQVNYIGESFENPARLVKAFSGEVHNASHIIDTKIMFDNRGIYDIDTSNLEPGTYYVQMKSYPIHDNIFITSEYFNVKPNIEEDSETPSFYTGSEDMWSCKVTPRDQNMDGESVIADFKLDEYVDFDVDIDLVEKKLYVSARIREDSKIYTDARIPKILFEKGMYEVEQIQRYSENDILISGNVPITCAGDNIIAVNYWILQGGRAVYKNAFYPLNIPEYENSEDTKLISFISWMREKGYSQSIVDRYEKIAKNPICRGWWMQHFFNLRDESVDHNNWLHFLDKIHNQSPVTIYFHDMIPTDQGAEHTALPDVGDDSNPESMESHFEEIFGCDFEFIYEAHNVNYVDTFGEPNYRGGFIDNFGGTRVSIMDACASLVGINKYNEGMSHIFHLAIDKLNGKRVDVMRHSPMLVTSLNMQQHSEWIHEYLHQLGIGHCYLAVDPFYSSSDYEPSLSVGLDSYMSTLGYVTSDGSKVRNRILCPLLRYAFEPKNRPYDDDATFAQVYNSMRDNGSWMLSENFPPRRSMVNIDIFETNSSRMKLKCLAGASFDHEGDDVTYSYQWYKNGVKQKGLTDVEIEILTEASEDDTPPIVSDINVGYITSEDENMIHFSWTASDGESGIQNQRYKYGKGTSDGVVDIINWTAIENTSVTLRDIIPGVTYYFSVKAINGVGLEAVSNAEGKIEEEEIVEEEPVEEEVEEEPVEEVVEEESEEEVGEEIEIIHTPIMEAEKGKDLIFFVEVNNYQKLINYYNELDSIYLYYRCCEEVPGCSSQSREYVAYLFRQPESVSGNRVTYKGIIHSVDTSCRYVSYCIRGYDQSYEGYMAGYYTIEMKEEKDTTPPSQPVVNSVVSPTREDEQVLSGTKEVGSSIVIKDGAEVVDLGELNNSENWQCRVGLEEGNNTFQITSKDAAGNESSEVEVVIKKDTTSPSQPSEGGSEIREIVHHVPLNEVVKGQDLYITVDINKNMRDFAWGRIYYISEIQGSPRGRYESFEFVENLGKNIVRYEATIPCEDFEEQTELTYIIQLRDINNIMLYQRRYDIPVVERERIRYKTSSKTSVAEDVVSMEMKI
jgi:hypothetical protein